MQILLYTLNYLQTTRSNIPHCCKYHINNFYSVLLRTAAKKSLHIFHAGMLLFWSRFFLSNCLNLLIRDPHVEEASWTVKQFNRNPFSFSLKTIRKISLEREVRRQSPKVNRYKSGTGPCHYDPNAFSVYRLFGNGRSDIWIFIKRRCVLCLWSFSCGCHPNV